MTKVSNLLESSLEKYLASNRITVSDKKKQEIIRCLKENLGTDETLQKELQEYVERNLNYVYDGEYTNNYYLSKVTI